MALGRRNGEQQDDLFIMAEHMPKAPGHVFYRKLNAILRDAGFDLGRKRGRESFLG